MLRPAACLALVLAASPLACAGGKSTEDRLLDEMRAEITAVQSDSDKFEEGSGRLVAEPPSEPSVAPASTWTEPPSSPPPPPPPPPAVATPDLPIVHLGPAGAEETGRASDTAGSAAADGDRSQVLSFTNANIGSALASHSAGVRAKPADADAKHAYDAAIKLVSARHYAEAVAALTGFLSRWPESPNAPDALLKLGVTEQHMDNAAQAKQHFDQLRRDFPHSDAARRIPGGPQRAPTAASSSPATP